MTESTLASTVDVASRLREHRAIALVSSAHFVNHFNNQWFEKEDFVDRIGSRRMLVLGLESATALFIFGRAPSYSRLLLATALLGLANSVFHPADYALLSA